MVEVFGHDIDQELEAAKSCIGLVPQEINFNMFETPFTIVVNQAGFYGIPRPLAKQRAEKYLKQLQLWDRRNSMARSLSGGMKRRLMIARALMHEPRLLILDEPTAGVDIEIRRSMWEFLRNINDAGHHHHPDHALSRRSRKSVPQRRHHRGRQHHRARQHGECAAQAADRGVRVQFARRRAARRRSCRDSPPVLSDEHTLEIEMSKTQSLNDIFAQLSAQGIAVNSMRNKVNRLEELFIRLVDGSAQRPRAAEGFVNGRIARARTDWIGFKTIIIREFSRIVRIWGQTMVPPAVTATLYFVIFGSLIGRRVGQVGGFDYMQFMAPGIIMMNVITDFLRQCGVVVLRREIRQAHRGTAGLAAAELADRRRLRHGRRAARRAGGLGGDHHFAVLHAPGAARMWSAIITAAFLTSVIFALGGFINALFAKNFDQISWFPTFVLTPLTYLGGVFYSVTMLPGWAHAVSHANPILYMVSAFRYGFLGTSDVDLRLAYGDHDGRRRRDVRAGGHPVEPRHRYPRIEERLRASYDFARLERAACSGDRREHRRRRYALPADAAGRATPGPTKSKDSRAAAAAAELQLEQRFDADLVGGGSCALGCSRWPRQPNHVGSPHDKANAEFQLAKFREWGWDASIEDFLGALSDAARSVGGTGRARPISRPRLTEPADRRRHAPRRKPRMSCRPTTCTAPTAM